MEEIKENPFCLLNPTTFLQYEELLSCGKVEVASDDIEKRDVQEENLINKDIKNDEEKSIEEKTMETFDTDSSSDVKIKPSEEIENSDIIQEQAVNLIDTINTFLEEEQKEIEEEVARTLHNLKQKSGHDLDTSMEIDGQFEGFQDQFCTCQPVRRYIRRCASVGCHPSNY